MDKAEKVSVVEQPLEGLLYDLDLMPEQCKSTIANMRRTAVEELRKEIERLKETLEFYALKRNYHNVTTDIVHKCGRVEWDMGKRARQTLKEE